MTRKVGRAGSAGLRLLLSAAAVAVTLVAWASLAQVVHVDAPEQGRAPAPVISGDPVEIPAAVDVTASASGRPRGRR